MHPSLMDHEAIRKELRRQRKERDRDPLVPQLAPKVWVAYIWEDRRWILAGFIRMQRVTQRRVNRWRKKMKLAKDAIVRWVELFTAARCGVNPRLGYHPHPSLRPDITPTERQMKRRRRVARA